MRTTPLPFASTDGDASDAVDDLALGFAPHCPVCLCPTEPWQGDRAVAWQCPQCDLAVIG